MSNETITIEPQLKGIHPDEVLRGSAYGFTYVKNGRLGYGETAYAAILDAGKNEVKENLPYVWHSPDFYFVSQCYDKSGNESGLLFKF